MGAGETQQAIEATFRIERARLIAGLARIVRNVDRAEELAQNALVIALSEWPRTGVPANPGAWLMARRANPDMSRAQALQLGMQAVRSGRRADGTAIAGWKAGWAHPAAWAAFTNIANRDD